MQIIFIKIDESSEEVTLKFGSMGKKLYFCAVKTVK